MRVRGVAGAFVPEVYDVARTEKACTSCGVVLPLGEFPRHRGKRDGLASRCKGCHRAASVRVRVERPEVVRAWRAAERDRCRAAHVGMRPVGKKRCPGCELVKSAEAFYREAKSYDGLSSRCRMCRAEWVQANWDLFLDYAQRRRARTRGVAWEAIDRLAVWRREAGRCYLCGKLVDRDGFHLEHVVPLALGGAHVLSNVRVAHPVCNLRKGAKLV